MIAKLLVSRIIDILLIAAAVYFLFPAIFRRTRKLRSEPQRHVNVTMHDKHKGSGRYDGEGEYVDYEEVK